MQCCREANLLGMRAQGEAFDFTGQSGETVLRCSARRIAESA